MEALSAPVNTTTLPTFGGVASKAAFEAAAKDFEAVFMAQMLKPMWEGVETNGMFGGGHGEDVMRDMLVNEYGKAMAQGGNIGLAPAIMDAMIRMQEASNGGKNA